MGQSGLATLHFGIRPEILGELGTYCYGFLLPSHAVTDAISHFLEIHEKDTEDTLKLYLQEQLKPFTGSGCTLSVSFKIGNGVIEGLGKFFTTFGWVRVESFMNMVLSEFLRNEREKKRNGFGELA